MSDFKNAAMSINEYLAEYLVRQNTRNSYGDIGRKMDDPVSTTGTHISIIHQNLTKLHTELCQRIC